MERLKVGDRAHQLALEIYRATEGWNDKVLSIQLRRSALSIPSNIAEGASRESRRDFARFVGIAFSSAAEVQYQLRLASDLSLLRPEHADYLKAEATMVKQMLWALLRALRSAERVEKESRDGKER